jgi:hypothetical protein
MEASTRQSAPQRKRDPHLWVILVTILALAALYPIGKLVSRDSLARATQEPVISPVGGYFDRDIQIEIKAPTSSSGEKRDVIFTLDGSVPTHTVGSPYTGPIHLRADEQSVAVIRARAVLTDGQLGPVANASYFIGVQTQLPMMSLIVEPDDLWNPERGIIANPSERGVDWERPADVTYVDRDRISGFHIPAGIRTHGGSSRDFEKTPLRLYFRQEYGNPRLEYPLFSASSADSSRVDSFKRLVLHSNGLDYPVSPKANWTLMRNQLMSSLASQMDGYASRSQPVLLYINGEPWGIYHIRERFDRFFLSDQLQIEQGDFLESPDVITQSDSVMGDREHWDHLMEFVETHDLTDPANYAYVQSQIDMPNLIDYNILQIYSANIDWPHRNVRQFRPGVQGGRWHWMVWDADGSFGANSGSRADADTISQLQNDNIPETNTGNALLMRRLFEIEEFRERFVTRTADLLNSILAPQSVIDEIDRLAVALEPDIAHETNRWPSQTDWAANVQELRDFALRRPDYVRQQLVERFGLNGTAELTVNPSPTESGSIAVNGMLIRSLPWRGVFFRDVPVEVTAVPNAAFDFAGWDPPHLPQEPTITLAPDAAQTITPHFEPVSDDVPHSGAVIFSTSPFNMNGVVGDGRFELRVTRPGGVDLRGWRVTDNDTKTATDEGSLIFTDNPAFARVPQGTRILIVPPQRRRAPLPDDDLSAWDRQMVIYVGNDNLDIKTDPGFILGPTDNLALLAPGPTGAFEDDRGIAFVANGNIVTPATFGILGDGVLPIQ